MKCEQIIWYGFPRKLFFFPDKRHAELSLCLLPFVHFSPSCLKEDLTSRIRAAVLQPWADHENETHVLSTPESRYSNMGQSWHNGATTPVPDCLPPVFLFTCQQMQSSLKFKVKHCLLAMARKKERSSIICILYFIDALLWFCCCLKELHFAEISALCDSPT